MMEKGENDIHQNVIQNGGITVRKDCFNEINKNYSEIEATRIGINTVSSDVHDTQKYENRLKKEKEKNNILITKNNRTDFSDLLEL